MADQRVGGEKGFDERKKKYEEKWALDEELRFKATARRNKLLGAWAAGELGLSGEDAEAYAKAVLAAALHAGGLDKAIAKITADLEAAGHTGVPDSIHKKLEELTAEATRQILHGER